MRPCDAHEEMKTDPKPGIQAAGPLVVKLGSSYRILDGCQSRPTASHRPPAGPPHDSSRLRERTKPEDHCAGVPDANWDVRYLLGICETQNELLAESRAGVFRKAARRSVCRARSRVALEFRVSGFRTVGWILAELHLGLVQKSAQGGAGTGITNNTFPGCIAVQFREQRRQLLHQLGPLNGRQFANGLRNFLNRAHTARTLTEIPSEVKLKGRDRQF